MYLQYVLGLRQLGCEVYWLERFRGTGDLDADQKLLDIFRMRMERFGLGGKLILYRTSGSRREPGLPESFDGMNHDEAEAIFDRADLLLNFHYAINPGLLGRFRRTALVDIDPGLLQFWISRRQLPVAAHDVYFTIGETVGTPAARFPDCGLRWIRIRPPVCLDRWPFRFDPAAEAFSTVSNWDSNNWIVDQDETYENTKRVAFLKFAELPRFTSQPLELALFLKSERDFQEQRQLEENGWRIRCSLDVSATPEAYQQYIQSARGEFSCAKPSYVRFRNAWVSDRTLCYLASGKPAVVQDTGPSEFLPHGEGMFRVSTVEGAAEAFETINRDYEKHCRAARRIAETFFDARTITAEILNHARDVARPLVSVPQPIRSKDAGEDVAAGILPARRLSQGRATTTVVVSPFNVVNFLEGGGHFWVYMQYVLGLRQLGCDVYWMEQFCGGEDECANQRLLAAFRARMEAFGLGGKLILYQSDGAYSAAEAPRSYAGLSRSDAEAVFDRADLLLNFHYAIHPSLLARFRRTAMVDIDPGLLQFWIRRHQLSVPPHDLYFTTGESIAAGRAGDGALRWIPIRPPVCLDRWPFCFDPQAEAFTTVSNWDADDWIVDEHETYENTKRVAFLKFADLPHHTSQNLELALYLKNDRDLEDQRQLEARGWRIRHSVDAAGTPEKYAAYIRASRGEFSCAKPSYLRFQNAWVSDRTICYLASGKPVVVQDTGPSSYLPNGEGMFRFSTLDQAAAALETIHADYEKHCRAARRIAETYFDARKITGEILNHALCPARPVAAVSQPVYADALAGSIRRIL